MRRLLHISLFIVLWGLIAAVFSLISSGEAMAQTNTASAGTTWEGATWSLGQVPTAIPPCSRRKSYIQTSQLIDLNTPVRSGLDAMRDIKERVTQTKLIILSYESGGFFQKIALANGADGNSSISEKLDKCFKNKKSPNKNKGEKQ